jgi:hypothetical protein
LAKAKLLGFAWDSLHCDTILNFFQYSSCSTKVKHKCIIIGLESMLNMENWTKFYYMNHVHHAWTKSMTLSCLVWKNSLHPTHQTQSVHKF